MGVCEICENKDFTLITTRIRSGEGRILKCEHCGLIIQDIGWGKQECKNYYETEYQVTNSLVRNKIQTPLEHFNDRLKTIGPIFEQIRPFLGVRSKVLEIGCGAGSLLSLIKPRVAKCVGVELNSALVNFMRDYLKIESFAGNIDELDFKESFDLVISIATLDHLPNPRQTLSAMKNLLSDSGKIYIEVPNCDQALNRFLPGPNNAKFNEFFWQPAHLFYFNQKTITELFKKVGLKIEISCRHDYTFKNFLNWYFLGKPQPGLLIGMNDAGFFNGKSDFELRMNKILLNMEKEFKTIMSETFCGESLCCVGYV
jgi:SAM-dependent methyltransferase